MFAAMPDKGADLRATVRRLTEQAAASERARRSAASLPECWTTAIRWLFHRVEHVYLLEFLMVGTMTIETVDREIFLPGFPAFAISSLAITVGQQQVALTPYVDHHAPGRVHLRMASRTHDKGAVLYCDIADRSPRWVMPSREEGLRRLLQAYLPEQAVDVNESVFRAALDAVLSGPQPVFSVGSAELRKGLSHVLDAATSDVLRRKLTLGLRASAASVGQHLLSAAPEVGHRALKALPDLARSAPLLPRPDKKTRGAE